MARNVLFAVASVLLVAQPVASYAVTIDFSGLADGTSVTTQYPGVTFSLQGLPDSSGSPTTYSYDGQEALANSNNSDYPTANILDVAFSSSISNLSFTFNNYGFGADTTYTLFGSAGQVLGTGDLQNVQDFTLVDVGPISGIRDLQFNNNAGESNWYYAVQTINYDVSSVPLPASAPMFGAALLALGAVGYGVKRRKVTAAS